MPLTGSHHTPIGCKDDVQLCLGEGNDIRDFDIRTGSEGGCLVNYHPRILPGDASVRKQFRLILPTITGKSQVCPSP